MTAIPRSRPGSPARQTAPSLPDIPEVVQQEKPTPGPNAFAQQASRMNRHRFEGNAFFQQEVQKRLAPPPIALHPALRPKDDSDLPSPRVPEMIQVRNSNVTTMSPFINAGMGKDSPPLRLVPEESEAFPTRRGFIEERREQILHETSGNFTDRTPVFTYTPKLGSTEFGKSVSSTPKKKKGRMSEGAAPDHSKSPRKGFLEKLRLTNPRASASSSAPTLVGAAVAEFEEAFPPKAQAILGSSPSKGNIGRSPSKKKGLFSRNTTEPPRSESFKSSLLRKSGASDPHTHTAGGKAPQTASTADFSDFTGKTLQTAHTACSDPTLDRETKEKRVCSQTQSDQGGERARESQKCQVSRSQSLQYFDRTTPPTPPAKNTPPHGKDNLLPDSKPLVQYQRIFQDDTPTRETVKLIDGDSRISPTKYGDYAQKDYVKLTKKPSVYSMHASVYPDFSDTFSYEEMRARVDGLGLEGLSEVPENFYHRKPEMVYSPSIYSENWGERPSAAFHSSPNLVKKEREDCFRHSPSLPAIWERHRTTPSLQTVATMKTSQSKQSGDSDATIPIVYPDIASDPSVNDLGSASHRADCVSLRTDSSGGGEGLLPNHGHTHSRDHSNSPRHSNATLFAKSFEDVHMSPASYSRPSAMPSPLQYLPATVYTPPRKWKKDAKADHERQPPQMDVFKKVEQTNLSSSPSKRISNPFQNAPNFLPRSDTPVPGRMSPSSSADPILDTDPQKATPTSDTFSTSDPQFDKLDQVLNLLSTMKSQNDEVLRLRDELCTANSRLGERLMSLENVYESDAPALYQPNGSLDNSATVHRDAQRRADMADENLCPAEANADRMADRVKRDVKKELGEEIGVDQLEKLPKGNAMEQLIDIVGGFAKRIEELEMRLRK